MGLSLVTHTAIRTIWPQQTSNPYNGGTKARLTDSRRAGRSTKRRGIPMLDEHEGWSGPHPQWEFRATRTSGSYICASGWFTARLLVAQKYSHESAAHPRDVKQSHSIPSDVHLRAYVETFSFSPMRVALKIVLLPWLTCLRMWNTIHTRLRLAMKIYVPTSHR